MTKFARIGVLIVAAGACGRPTSSTTDGDGSVRALLSDGRASHDAGQVTRRPPVKQLVAGEAHTCALFEDGAVHCWGRAAAGELGSGSAATIGDDEPASAGDDVVLGGPAEQLAAGTQHTCALMRSGAVRCWGEGDHGRLGYGNTRDVGVDVTPAQAGDVALGEPAMQIAAGAEASCALLASGAIHCWGEGTEYRLGYGNVGPGLDDIGDDETPASVPPLRLQHNVKQLALAAPTSCALFDQGTVRCWGGSFGFGHDEEDQPAAEGRDVQLGTRAVAIGAGATHHCAITSKARLRCWGSSESLSSAYAGKSLVGIAPNPLHYPTPARLGDVPTISDVQSVASGAEHACVLLSGGRVRCWGGAVLGQVGYGKRPGGYILVQDAGDMPLPSPARLIAAGTWHTCVLLDDETVRCWGRAAEGQLGYGNTENVYDAASAPPVPL